MYTSKNFFVAVIFVALPFLVFSKSENKSKDVVNTSLNKAGALSFLENNGRIRNQDRKKRDDIDFSLSGSGVNLYIGNGIIQYQWSKPLNNDNSLGESERVDPISAQKSVMSTPIALARVDVKLIGANKDAKLIKSDKHDYFEKHYLADSKDEVITNTYGKVTYKDIYPNIDWVLYTQNNHLKYDFIVREGGNVNDIKIQYGGTENIKLVNGSLQVETPLGSITEQAPYSYNAETKEVINSSFKLDGNVLSFEIAEHDGTVVIDPFLDWATYHGGNNYDWGSTVTTDYLGNIYLGGWTYSSNNIASSSNVYMDTLHPNVLTGYWYYNGYIAKFDDTGKKLWGTYYPGFINAMVCDGFGNLYVTGWTDSIPSMATPGAHQDTFGGRNYTYYYYNGDAFISKFTTTGSRVWSTFYGGEGTDGANAITLDPVSGYLYVGGHTSSRNNIASSPSVHLDTLPPYRNYYYYGYYNSGWFGKFSTNGVRQWATYYPGMVTSISVDNSGDLAIAGTTFDTAGIATPPNAHQTLHAGIASTNAGDRGDGFIAKFNSNGVRQWGTYYGGVSWDWLSGIDHDESDNIYVTGTTINDIWMGTSDGHQPRIGSTNTYDAHLAKFSPSGTRLWATYYGGSSYDWGNSVKVSPLGKIYINGQTLSPNGNNIIATNDGHYTALQGSYDAFIVEFDQAGNRTWGTYYGGPGYEYSGGWGWGGGWGSNGSHSLDASVAGKLYMSSATWSQTGIHTPDAHQTQLNGSYDAFLVSFVVDTLPYVKHPFDDTLLCAGDTVEIDYGVTFDFQAGNEFKVQLSDANGGFGGTTIIGSIEATSDSTIKCVIPTNIPNGEGYRVRIIADNPSRVSADNQLNMKIYSPPSQLVASSNSAICVGDTLKLFGDHDPLSGVTYAWTGPSSYTSSAQNPVINSTSLTNAGDYILTATIAGKCSSIDTASVVVNIIPAVPTASSNSVVCPNTTLTLFAASTTANSNYNWRGPNSFTSSNQNPALTPATYGMAGTYYVSATKDGCTSEEDSVTVAVAITTPTPSASSNSPVCEKQTVELTSTTINNATYKWVGPNNYSNTTPNLTNNIAGITKNGAGTYYLTAIVNGCESRQDSVVIVVNDAPDISVYPSPGDSICVGGDVTFVSLSNFAGNNPQYQWWKNNAPITGATNTTYKTGNVTSGDIFFCTITSNTTCTDPASDTSVEITMVVRPIVAPTLSITADPSNNIKEDELVTFTANATYAGKQPVFQWKINGNPVLGATSNIWGTTTLTDGDVISVDLISNDPCAQPKTASSNEIKMQVALSVGNINSLSALQLYPNPNTGTFTISGSTQYSGDISLDIINAVGQAVYHNEIKAANGTIDEVINLDAAIPSGVYMLRLSADNSIRTLRFNVNK